MARHLGALMYSGVSSAFRIQFSPSQTRLQYLTKGLDNGLDILETSLLSHFPTFSYQRPMQIITFPFEPAVSVALLSGVPRSISKSLDSMTEMLSQSKSHALYQVWAVPRKPSYSERLRARKRYKSNLQKVADQQSQDTFFGPDTRTVIDPDALRTADHLEALYNRMNSKFVLECHVIIAVSNTHGNDAVLQNAVNILLSSISPLDKDQQFNIKYLSRKKAFTALESALMLAQNGKGTPLLPAEAVPFFDIPLVDIGAEHTHPVSLDSN